MQDDGDNSEIITTDNCDAPILHMTSAACSYELLDMSWKLIENDILSCFGMMNSK